MRSAGLPVNGIGIRPHSLPKTCDLIESSSFAVGPFFDFVLPSLTVMLLEGVTGLFIFIFCFSSFAATTTSTRRLLRAVRGIALGISLAMELFLLEDLDFAGV